MKYVKTKQYRALVQGMLLISLVLFLPVHAVSQHSGEPDYQREFIENFFAEPESGSAADSGPGQAADESAGLRIQRSPDDVEQADGDDDADGVSISALGKILQISLVLLLAGVIYVQSQRSKRRSRF